MQPSQNVPAASHLATCNEISATYFTLVRLVFRMRLFQVVVHHCKVQIIRIKYFHLSYAGVDPGISERGGGGVCALLT